MRGPGFHGKHHNRGAVGGAVAGGILGHQNGWGLEGAALGGAVAGSAKDEENTENKRE